EEFDLEDERGVGRNAARALSAIGELWRNDELAAAAHAHPGEAFVPAVDDLASTQCKRNRLAPYDGAVEERAVGEPAVVVHPHHVARLGHFAVAFFKVVV